jgi:hypothetical protein
LQPLSWLAAGRKVFIFILVHWNYLNLWVVYKPLTGFSTAVRVYGLLIAEHDLRFFDYVE